MLRSEARDVEPIPVWEIHVISVQEARGEKLIAQRRD